MNIRDRIKDLRRVPANELRPNPRNWRTHPEKHLDAIRGVLAEVGFAGAELARELDDGTLELIDGHARAEVAGTAEVPVLVLDVDEAEANKILATFDPIGAMAESDAAKLDAVLRDVDTGSEALQEMLADLADDADLYLDDEPEVVEDEVPEPPADPVTQPGDVWLLGRHRLLCGDSTDASQVKRIVEGNKANMVFTDPPYNIAFKGTLSDTSKDGKKVPHKPANTKHKNIKNDAKTKNEFQEFVFKVLDVIKNYCEGAYYIAFCSGNLHELLHPLANSIGYKSIIIWTKNQSPMGAGAYRRRYEPIVYGNFSSEFYGKAYSEDDVWQFDRTRKNDMHPTMKPVELITHAIRHGSKKGHSVLDSFLGSGTTLIAAEQIDRTCYGLEISPEYCDVIVERWQNLTGEKATRENGIA